MNILFTCVGRRTYLLRYFKENLGSDDRIIATDMQLTAPALSIADVKVQVPSVYDENYIDTVLEICRQHDVKALISLNDLELPVLSENRSKFEEIGVIPIVSSPNVIDICFDKFKTARYIDNIGLKSPKTFKNPEAALTALNKNELSFPLVLKPRWGSGSIGVEFVNSIAELTETYASLVKKIKQSILATASDEDECIIIQQKINGQEYGMDVMNDFEGNCRAVSVKKKLAMRAGETDKACTIDNPEIRKIGTVLGNNLKHVGNLDVDIFETNGQYYVLELNPRFGGGFPFSYEAGVNFPGAIVGWLKGKEIDNNTLQPTYGLSFAKCDYLVRVDNQDPAHETCIWDKTERANYGGGINH